MMPIQLKTTGRAFAVTALLFFASQTMAEPPKPVAHFAVVSHQYADCYSIIPLVAFCKGGIHHVEFKWDNTTKIVDTSSKVDQFAGRPFEAFVLTGCNYPDGATEINATIYPNRADFDPRVVSITVFGGSFKPAVRKVGPREEFQAIEQARDSLINAGEIDGAHIKLAAGTYALSDTGVRRPTDNDRWVVIEPMEGVDRADVVINSNGPSRFAAKRLCIRGVTLTQRVVGTYDECEIWIDDCDAKGDIWHASSFRGARYVTDSIIDGSFNGVGAAHLARNTSVPLSTSEIATNARCVINCDAGGVDIGDTEAHADIFQHYLKGDEAENIMLYGLKCKGYVNAQGLFFRSDGLLYRNVAVVNCDINARNSQVMNISLQHFLLWNNWFHTEPSPNENGYYFWIRDNRPPLDEHCYWDVRNNIFTNVGGGNEESKPGVNWNDWTGNVINEESPQLPARMRAGRPIRVLLLDANGKERGWVDSRGPFVDR